MKNLSLPKVFFNPDYDEFILWKRDRIRNLENQKNRLGVSLNFNVEEWDWIVVNFLFFIRHIIILG